MLSAERKIRIIEYVKKNKSATITKLAKEFNVHEVTIRRDLASIEKEGILKRTHGGVILNQWSNKEPPFDDRAFQNMEEKMRIGERAASMVEDGDHIILDSGTTTHSIAKNLKNKNDLTVVTNDMNIAIELKDSPQIKVILTGGEIYSSSYVLHGIFTEQILRSVRVIKAFIGTPALHTEHGLMHMDAQLVADKKQMIDSAQETIVVSDSSKIGKLSLYQVAPLSSINTLINGKETPSELIEPFRDFGILVYQV